MIPAVLVSGRMQGKIGKGAEDNDVAENEP